MDRTLYGLTVSPWTERARWALDHHRVAYGYHEHVPMIGEVLLRMKARATKASVPLLDDDGYVVMGSVNIVKHADRIGGGAPLFPSASDGEIARWVDIAERMMSAGRAWFTKRFLANRDAQAESLPSFVPAGVRSMFAPTASMAVRFLANKYGVPADVDRVVDETLRPLLRELRAALDANRDTSAGAYLIGSDFTAADLVLASTMQIVRPHAAAKLKPHTREMWTHAELAAEFGDLLEWRDAIYAKHRPERAA